MSRRADSLHGRFVTSGKMKWCGMGDIFPQMTGPGLPAPGFHTPVIRPEGMPPVTVLEPSNLTSPGPVSAPPTVRVDDPLQLIPRPPLR